MPHRHLADTAAAIDKLVFGMILEHGEVKYAKSRPEQLFETLRIDPRFASDVFHSLKRLEDANSIRRETVRSTSSGTVSRTCERPGRRTVITPVIHASV